MTFKYKDLIMEYKWSNILTLTSVTDVPLESVAVWTLPPLTAMSTK